MQNFDVFIDRFSGTSIFFGKSEAHPKMLVRRTPVPMFDLYAEVYQRHDRSAFARDVQKGLQLLSDAVQKHLLADVHQVRKH